MDDRSRDDLPAHDLLALGDLPLADDDALLERARSLLGEGLVPRLWLLLLDEEGRQLPLLPQIEGSPRTPDAAAPMTVRTTLGVVAEVAAQVAVVLERPGRPSPTPDDLAWCDAIRRGARGLQVELRAVLLAHGRGVDRLWPAPTGAAA